MTSPTHRRSYPTDLERAIAIAVGVHRGQTDKQGREYILHAFRVMLAVPPGVWQVVAALHDVIEDSDWTMARLEIERFDHTVMRAVDSITRRPGETYADYIERVALDDVATVVKVADLNDHLARIGGLSDVQAESMSRRYRNALATLQAVL
jgi:(p)ppGpp synthase/HD superfamily hydrolase